jgi:tetratricopeptide (TPR) repeat protein
MLVKAGQHEFAQQLFSQFESALKEQIRQWPEDAMSLNNLAWMYAKCNVKLNEALELSRKAVGLVPSSAVYLDTLAEVHYHRGEVDLAIETMRDCVRIDPRGKGYRKNLVRFSTGKP